MTDKAFLEEVCRRLGCSEQRAQTITLAVLQELRDRLPEREAADVEAQLPTQLKKLWFEPGRTGHPVEKSTLPEFIARVRARFPFREDADARRAIRVVFGGLQHVLRSERGLDGEAWDVFSVLPKDMKELWLDARKETWVSARVVEPPTP